MLGQTLRAGAEPVARGLEQEPGASFRLVDPIIIFDALLASKLSD